MNKSEASLKKNDMQNSQSEIQNVGSIVMQIQSNSREYTLFEVKKSEEIQKKIDKTFDKTIKMNIVFFIIVFFCSLIGSIIIALSISKPVIELSNKALVVSNGDLAIDSINVKTHDEIRGLSKIFLDMVTNLRNIIIKIYNFSGDVKISTEQISQSSNQNAHASEEISTLLVDVITGIQVQNKETQNTLESVEYLYGIANDVKNQTNEISNNAKNSVKLAEDGNNSINGFMLQLKKITELFEDASDAARQMNHSTLELNGILSTVTKISSHTKLLSINAGIEAMKAGEAGRGFSVVAKEVKKLSEVSIMSVKRIGQIISEIQTVSENIVKKTVQTSKEIASGNVIAKQITESFGDIKNTNNAVNSDIQGILERFKSLIIEIEKVKLSMKEIDICSESNTKAVENISASVEQQTASLEQVSASSTLLFEMVEELENTVKKFKIS